MKVNITVNDELMKRIDDFGKENYLSRSTLMSLACTQYLNSQEALKVIKEMSVCLRRIADNGLIDDKDRQELANLEYLSKMMLGN